MASCYTRSSVTCIRDERATTRGWLPPAARLLYVAAFARADLYGHGSSLHASDPMTLLLGFHAAGLKCVYSHQLVGIDGKYVKTETSCFKLSQ